MTTLAREARAWALHPVVYYSGTGAFRQLASSRPRLDRLVRAAKSLGDVEILSVSDRSGLEAVRQAPVTSVHRSVVTTDRELRPLVAAYGRGSFHMPTRMSWNAVARSLGLSRSTFGKHLRKGQFHLLQNGYPTLKARMHLRRSRRSSERPRCVRGGEGPLCRGPGKLAERSRLWRACAGLHGLARRRPRSRGRCSPPGPT